jgi:hypothetical protein
VPVNFGRRGRSRWRVTAPAARASTIAASTGLGSARQVAHDGREWAVRATGGGERLVRAAIGEEKAEGTRMADFFLINSWTERAVG